VDILQVGRNDEAGYFYYVMELADPAERPKECPKSELRSPNLAEPEPKPRSVNHR
jgi:hypothetical protein